MQMIYLVIEIIDQGCQAHFAYKNRWLAEKECEKLNEGKPDEPFKVEAIPLISSFVA